MRPADLTSVEIADRLARVYNADLGQSDDIPSPAERTTLADYLGCHEEARAAAWAAELNPLDWDQADYWLDVEFIETWSSSNPTQSISRDTDVRNPCVKGEPVKFI
ncbi:TerB family tellurite resistance protein [Deinococcus saxicola]|uniref:hypothetical protein n=1 Tax=Deinococcus saxicola TaxID=249406 RepID=UPI0039F0E6DF